MKKVHFLGIGGSGASAIAKIAEAQGFEVTGCDLNPNNEFTSVFQKGQLFVGHDPKHLEYIDILAVTPAIYSLDPNNPELLEAKKAGIEILSWQEFMGKYLEKDKFVIAVSGTHGKSTTTAMIGQLLEDAGLDPTVELGAIVPKWGSNFRLGKGKPVLSEVEGYFVTEADEFNDNFLVTHPDVAVVTTIEMDHPEYFKDFDAYKASFAKFLKQTKEKIIANLSDKGVSQVLNNILRSEVVLTTESRSSADSSRLRSNNKIEIVNYSKHLIDFSLQIPGEFNVLNASAVYQVGLTLGIKSEVIQKSLENFTGIDRRFEKIGEVNEAQIYSDFAHHPTEIKVTLQSAREKFPDKKITVIFQPHMFSRTKALFADFVEVLQNSPADKTYLLDIFPSREVDTGLVNTKQLVEAINQENVKYIASSDELLNLLAKEIKVDDVVIFMGAGDTDKLAKKLVKDLPK